jgi:hypothetical protein
MKQLRVVTWSHSLLPRAMLVIGICQDQQID